MMEVTWHGIDKETGRAWQHRIMEWAASEGCSDMDAIITMASAKAKRELFHKELGADADFPGDAAFRGFCYFSRDKTPRIYIFIDEYETEESIWWLLFHELAHVELRTSDFFFGAVARQKMAWLRSLGVDEEQYRSDHELKTRDGIHESDPEEIFCNVIATSYMGRDYSRKWWRKRRAELRLEATS